MTSNANNFNDAIDSEDVLVNSIRAIKRFIPARRDEAKNTPFPEADVKFKNGYMQAMSDIDVFIKALHI